MYIPQIGGMIPPMLMTQTTPSIPSTLGYLEVYNERVRDLLRPSSNCVGLRVREHPRLGPYVQGLTHHAVPTLGSLISRVEEGTKARKTASTLQNPTSSRSHALLTLSLLPTSDKPGQPGTGSPTTSSGVSRRGDFPLGSKLHLVDLAGSESAAACGGINRLKEGANINKSLVALGNVISALADRGLARSSPGRRFIPYRDSALTWLLKDVLGGNATTVMLATISPASGSYNETSHTLRFAQRAQSVINRPVINEDPVSRIIRELRAEVARLKSLLLEKNVNPDVGSTSVCPYFGDREPEVNDGISETRGVDGDEKDKEHEKPNEADRCKPVQRRYSESPLPEKESPSNRKRCNSLDHHQESISSRDFDGWKYNQARISELSVNDEVDESAFVDIPTLVAVLIKPEENIQANSHQIEEIICSDIVDEGIEFQENADQNLSIETAPAEILSPINPEEAQLKSKLRKQESIDGDFPSKKSTNLHTLKKYGSIESLVRKAEISCPIERPNGNLEKRNGSLGKIKKLNNIKEIDDPKSNKPGNLWRNLGIGKDLQQRAASDVDKKDLKLKIQPKRQNFDGLKRKTSKDSSSSSSKDDLLPRDRSSRKGSLDQELITTRVHTPIQRASRAEIVAAVTERLFSSKKISEDSNTATTTSTASEGRSPESTDVKIAAATRMRLQEISRKMLAKRRRICVDTQTDNNQTIRVRDTASLTEQPKTISKDASILTDRHEDFETLPSTGPVLRVKEISTLTETNPPPVIRCKNVGIVTDDFTEDYPTIGYPRNDSGIVSDEVPTDSGSHFDIEMSDSSTNTAKPSGPSDSGSQTLKDDLIDRYSHFESRCCGRSKYSGYQGRDRNLPHTENNVISISLPDMVNITIESSNGLESKIRVFDGNEPLDEKKPTTLKDNEAQTDAKNALEIGTSTDDVFGQVCFNDFSFAKPIVAPTDGKPFRIENIFHETGNANRINPRIEIVADTIGSEIGKNSLTVTNSVGTFFVPETRENATGMEAARRYSFAERFGRPTARRSMNNDSFGKSTWPGQWRSRAATSRRKFSSASGAENQQTLSNVPIISFDLDNYRPAPDSLIHPGQLGFNAKELVIDELGLQKNAPRINDRKSSCIKSPAMNVGMDSTGFDQDTNFSDDSLDLMEDKITNPEAISSNFKKPKSEGAKCANKPCPPDVVAHTKKEIDVPSTPNTDGLEFEDFDDSQQIVFPKVKLNSTVPPYTTPISDFKSLILGDSCCSANRDSEDLGSKLTSNDSCSNDDVEDVACLYSERSSEPKSIIKKSLHPKSKISDQRRILKNREHSSGMKKVHFAVPEVCDSTSSDSEMCENLETDDETDGARNILEEYLDEAVVFMRNMNSMNEYMSAACGIDKNGTNNRSRRRGKAKSPNYIEYGGRRINLDDDKEDPNSDEDLDFNVESYEKCLRSMDRLEECLAKVKRHHEILRDTYGIQVNGSTGAKLDLVRSGVDPKEPKECPNHQVKSEGTNFAKKSPRGKVVEINGNVDGQIDDSSCGDDTTYPGSNDDRIGVLRKASNGCFRFSDFAPKDQTLDYQSGGRCRDSIADGEKGKEDTLESRVKIESTESEEPNTSDMLRVPGCYLTLPKTKRVVMGLSEGIKNSCGRPWLSLSKYELSSNKSSSSNEPLESFIESIDNATRSRDKFKYPGSPRSKFLQLLSERRRIVENTRNTGVS